MSDAEVPLQPKKKGLTRRQKRSLSRGVQYVVFVAAVIAFAVAADWDRLKNQFAQGSIAREMFPEVVFAVPTRDGRQRLPDAAEA